VIIVRRQVGFREVQWVELLVQKPESEYEESTQS
jgi:hypothetical protein